jgi:hypothetical protein
LFRNGTAHVHVASSVDDKYYFDFPIDSTRAGPHMSLKVCSPGVVDHFSASLGNLGPLLCMAGYLSAGFSISIYYILILTFTF